MSKREIVEAVMAVNEKTEMLARNLVQVADGQQMQAKHMNQYKDAIEHLFSEMETLKAKMQDELMNFMLLGDHECKCKCQSKDVHLMSAEEYLNLEYKL